MKGFRSFLIPAILLSIITIVNSTQYITIDCKISKIDFVYFNKLTSCAVKSKPNIVSPDIAVTGVLSGSTVGVKVFYTQGQVIRYIPKNLDVVFPDIFGIWLESSQLKLVSKEDLQSFPGLLMFASVDNDIQFLEQDLFINNPKLQVVSFQGNKITYIQPNVFSSISMNLQQLYLEKQGINCGLGNSLTPKDIKADLAKLSSSKCADILNAPPLYVLWINLKQELSNLVDYYSYDLQMCQNEAANCETNSQTCQSNLEAVSADNAACYADKSYLTTEFNYIQNELFSCNATIDQCAIELESCHSGQSGSCATDLTICQGELATLSAVAAVCEIDKATRDDNFAICAAQITTCTVDLSTCDADLTLCYNCRADPAHDPKC